MWKNLFVTITNRQWNGWVFGNSKQTVQSLKNICMHEHH